MSWLQFVGALAGSCLGNSQTRLIPAVVLRAGFFIASLFSAGLIGFGAASEAAASDVGGANAGESTHVLRWSYAPGDVRGQQLESSEGDLTGRIVGAVKSAAKPDRIEFDGRSRVIVADDVSSLSLPTSAVSIETWVRVDKLGRWCGFVSAIQDNGAFERGWLLGFQDGRFCFGLVSTTTGRIEYLSARESISIGAWYHVAGVYDGKLMKLYVDGKLAAESKTQRGPVLYPPRGVLALGAYVDDNETYPLKGAMAETAIHGRPLSAKDVGRRFRERKDVYPNTDVVQSHVVGWPTYMHDDARSGATQERVAPPLYLQWRYKARHPPQPAWPPPAARDIWHRKHNLRPLVTFDRAFHLVSDGRRVYFGSSADDQLRALELKNGQEHWSFFAEGPIRLAPTIANGRVYFGSDDGRVYCLEAGTGKLVWRFDARPRQRVISGNGRLISVYPVRTGVIVHDDVARFGAGLFPAQGTFQFALDAETGKELARGPLKFSPQGYLERHGNVLQVARGRVGSAALAEVSLPSGKGNQGGKANHGKRLNSTRPKEYPFAWIRAGEHYFGGGDGEVAALVSGASQPIWNAEVDGNVYSLAVAGGRLLVSTDTGSIYCFGPKKLTAAHAPITQADEHRPTLKPSGSPTTTRKRDAEQRDAEAWWSRINAYVGPQPGYCLLLGGDASQARILAEKTRLRVVVVREDSEEADRLRTRLDEAGVYGRVVVRVVAPDRLPFASRLFNLVILADQNNVWNPAAVAPLVRPAGGILVDTSSPDLTSDARRRRMTDWQSHGVHFKAAGLGDLGNAGDVGLTSPRPIVLRRPKLRGEGQWTHMYGDAANTACSGEQQNDGALELQWFGRPGPRAMVDRHHRATPPLYTSGRLFVPGNEQVFGVDAYNGTILWRIDLPNFRRVGAPRDAGNMAATVDTLYAVAKDHCHALRTNDGSQRAVFAPPAMDDGRPRDWGFVAVVDDSLYGSSTQPGASRSGHSRGQISETYYDFVPLVTSDSVFDLDRQSGELRWQYTSRGAILNPTITLGGGRLYFVESRDPRTLDAKLHGRVKLDAFFREGADLVALERSTGEEMWRCSVDFSKIQHHLFLAYAQEKLVTAGTRNEAIKGRSTVRYDLTVFDAKTGTLKWTSTQDQGQAAGGSHGEQDHHLAIVGDQILQEPFAYDLNTGRRRKDWRFARGGHGCGTISASASAIFYRAGNPTMCDLATGKRTRINAVSRPGCWINIIPAGGLVLIPEASSGCTCNYSIQSSMAFAVSSAE